jgi:hypothetical protein
MQIVEIVKVAQGLIDDTTEATENIGDLWDEVNNIETHPPIGGPTAKRPLDPFLYGCYFDTTLGIPIWWDGTKWVDAGGVTV